MRTLFYLLLHAYRHENVGDEEKYSAETMNECSAAHFTKFCT